MRSNSFEPYEHLSRVLLRMNDNMGDGSHDISHLVRVADLAMHVWLSEQGEEITDEGSTVPSNNATSRRIERRSGQSDHVHQGDRDARRLPNSDASDEKGWHVARESRSTQHWHRHGQHSLERELG